MAMPKSNYKCSVQALLDVSKVLRKSSANQPASTFVDETRIDEVEQHTHKNEVLEHSLASYANLKAIKEIVALRRKKKVENRTKTNSRRHATLHLKAATPYRSHCSCYAQNAASLL
ncbi:unnamed protein product [Calypogeia fissa]